MTCLETCSLQDKKRNMLLKPYLVHVVCAKFVLQPAV